MTRKTVHTIYGLFDPTDPAEEIRYVGFTSFTVEQRIIDHVAGAKKAADTHKKKWIRVLLRKNVLPVFYILERTTRNWQKRERYWIRTLRKHGCRLTNSTVGGDGLVDPSPEVRKRISEKVSKLMLGNQYRKGKRGTPEYGAHQSKTLRASKRFKAAHEKRRGKPGPKHSEETRELISQLKTGVPRPDMQWFGKTQAKKNKGSFWTNDGTNNVLLRKGTTIPEGFIKGRLMVGRPHTEEARKKMSEAKLGKPGPIISREGKHSISESRKNSRWITNGEDRRSIPVGIEPPPGWRFGFNLEAPI